MLFISFTSTSGSTINAIAPFETASCINSIPFLVKPLIAKNNPFFSIFLYFECILVISKFRSPTLFLTSTLEINLSSNI